MIVPHAILVQATKRPHHIFNGKPRRHFAFVFELIESPLPAACMHQLQALLFHQKSMGVVNTKILRELFELFKMVVKGATPF